MRNTKLLILAVLAATIFTGAGCSTSDDESVTETDLDGASFEPATKETLEDIGQNPTVQIGCSNRQIRSAQDACRNTFCGTRGSNGIHFCDQRVAQGIVVAQCDCTTGADPTIQCSLSACPQ